MWNQENAGSNQIDQNNGQFKMVQVAEGKTFNYDSYDEEMERLDNKENIQSNLRKDQSQTSSKGQVKIVEPRSPKSSKFKNEQVQSDEKDKFERMQKQEILKEAQVNSQKKFDELGVDDISIPQQVEID